VLLLTCYVVFSLAYVLAFVATMPQLIAMLPFLLSIIVLCTWRYVNVTFEYIIAVGEITFSRIFGNKKRKDILCLSVRELVEVSPDMGEKLTGFDKVYDFRSECGAPDSYILIYKDEKEQRCLVYFEATKKALKLLQLYNPGAVKFGKTLRY
jgi:hypothetical protein